MPASCATVWSSRSHKMSTRMMLARSAQLLLFTATTQHPYFGRRLVRTTKGTSATITTHVTCINIPSSTLIREENRKLFQLRHACPRLSSSRTSMRLRLRLRSEFSHITRSRLCPKSTRRKVGSNSGTHIRSIRRKKRATSNQLESNKFHIGPAFVLRVGSTHSDYMPTS